MTPSPRRGRGPRTHRRGVRVGVYGEGRVAEYSNNDDVGRDGQGDGNRCVVDCKRDEVCD